MFNTGNSGYSLSDIAAVTGSNRDNDGFGSGNGGAWWIIILFLFCFMGWGNNRGGWGNNDGGSNGNGGSSVMFLPSPYSYGFSSPSIQGALTRGDLCSEFSFNDLQSGVRGLEQGICSLGYDQLAQVNGVNANIAALNSNLNNAICTLGYNVQQGQNATDLAILNSQNAQTIAAMQNQNALQTQIAQCCCDNKSQIKDVQYQMATDTCAINTNASNNTRDIIDSQNAGTRAILEAIQQGKIDALQDKIAALTAQNTQLAFQASQNAQNTYLVDQLRPCPVPAYITCNPWGNTVPYGSCSCA